MSQSNRMTVGSHPSRKVIARNRQPPICVHCTSHAWHHRPRVYLHPPHKQGLQLKDT